jgi:membrane fusion protein, copper/silver efflux system
MRRLSIAIVVVAIVASYVLGRQHAYAQKGGKTGRHVLYYVDPMHPTYKSDKPGIAPDCGMQLEPVYGENGGNAPPSSPLAGSPAGAVSFDGAQQLLAIRVVPVETKGITRNIRVVGRVVPEDTRVYRVNSGTEGFVREIYNDSVGVLVKKDQKLATCYSPEFLALASGFLASSERTPGYQGIKDGNRTVPKPGALSKQGFSSIQGYADRLRNLGMSDAQIKTVADSHQLPEDIDVVAPTDGFILARNISAGLHFDRDLEFYRIADLSRVWVVAEVYEQEAQYLHRGGSARITLPDQGRQLPARITDSLPQSEAGGGTVKLRLEVDNPTFRLRPEMLVDVELPVRLPSAVTVPLDAVVDSGTRARVYVASGEGTFNPREVETGWRFGERVEILHGVQPGERVVASATFLVDSESRLKAILPTPEQEAASDKAASVHQHLAVAKTVRDPSCGMQVDPAAAAAFGNTLVYRGTTYYFCSLRCKQTFQNNPIASVARHQGDAID